MDFIQNGRRYQAKSRNTLSAKYNEDDYMFSSMKYKFGLKQ